MSTRIEAIVAARRERLRQWIDSEFDGVQAKFVAASGINQGELSLLLKDKPFGEKRADSLEEQAGMPVGYLLSPLDKSPSSQAARHDDATMTQAVELLYLMADARPEDKRFRRLNWAMILLAAKGIQNAEGDPRKAMANILADLAKET